MCQPDVFLCASATGWLVVYKSMCIDSFLSMLPVLFLLLLGFFQAVEVGPLLVLVLLFLLFLRQLIAPVVRDGILKTHHISNVEPSYVTAATGVAGCSAPGP